MMIAILSFQPRSNSRDIERLRPFINEYVLTLDNADKDEWWCTQRQLEEGVLAGFLEWLIERLPPEPSGSVTDSIDVPR